KVVELSLSSYLISSGVLPYPEPFPIKGLCSTSLVPVLQPVVNKKPEAKEPVNNSLRFSLLFIAGYILNISFFQFTDNIIRSSPGKGKDGPCGVFIRLGDKWSTIYHK